MLKRFWKRLSWESPPDSDRARLSRQVRYLRSRGLTRPDLEPAIRPEGPLSGTAYAKNFYLYGQTSPLIE